MPTKFSVVLIEDDIFARQIIEKRLRELFPEQILEFHSISEITAIQTAVTMLQELKLSEPVVYLFDCHMGDDVPTGYDLAESFLKIQPNARVGCISSNPNYQKGYPSLLNKPAFDRKMTLGYFDLTVSRFQQFIEGLLA